MAKQAQSVYRYDEVPGKSRVVITIIPETAPDPSIRGADGHVHHIHTVPLSQVIKALGGYEGQLRDPLAGQWLHADLRNWVTADPERTRCVLSWSFSPRHPIAARHRLLFDEWELTHDRYSTLTEDSFVKVFDGTTPFQLVYR